MAGLAPGEGVRGRQEERCDKRQSFHLRESKWSGQEDLNLRPHGPEPCALTRLSYAPSFGRSCDQRRDSRAPRERSRILGESGKAVKRQAPVVSFLTHDSESPSEGAGCAKTEG